VVRVVVVTDGDAITLLDSGTNQHKIRLSGIDAPEKGQPFGSRSKQSLSDLVFSKTVIVDTYKQDKYKQNIGKVLVEGIDANLEQVKRGLAWHFKAYEREQSTIDRQMYDAQENEAKLAKRGLWIDSDPMPPWKFRHRERP
jgi:endonuclease YncB( thermonuclease family)